MRYFGLNSISKFVFFFRNLAFNCLSMVSIFVCLHFLFCSNKKSYSHQFNGILSDQRWQKMMMVWTCLENHSLFFGSTSCNLTSTCQSIAFYLKRIADSKNSRKLSFTSDLESWLIKCIKSFFSVDLSSYSTSTLAKTTFLNPSIKVPIDSDIFLNVSSMKQILTVSFRCESSWAEHAKRLN